MTYEKIRMSFKFEIEIHFSLKVIDNYLKFYKFGSLLNKVCGWVIFGTVICCPPFFVVYLMGTLNNSEAAGPRIIFYSVI